MGSLPGAMTKKQRLLDRVRVHIAAHGGRPREPVEQSVQPVMLVHAYVNELELVINGVETHVQMLQRMRAAAMGALDALEARSKDEHNPIFEWYVDAARIYIAALELTVAGENVGEEQMQRGRLWYDRMREII